MASKPSQHPNATATNSNPTNVARRQLRGLRPLRDAPLFPGSSPSVCGEPSSSSNSRPNGYREKICTQAIPSTRLVSTYCVENQTPKSDGRRYVEQSILYDHSP